MLPALFEERTHYNHGQGADPVQNTHPSRKDPMSPFTFSLWRFAYSPDQRHTMQEFNGWWRHLGFGLFVFTYKRTHGWV